MEPHGKPVEPHRAYWCIRNLVLLIFAWGLLATQLNPMNSFCEFFSSHMGTEPCVIPTGAYGALWEQMEHYGALRCPIESLWEPQAALWNPVGALWCVTESILEDYEDICELYAFP